MIFLEERNRIMPGDGIKVIPLVFRTVVVAVAGVEGGTLVTETFL